MKKLESSLKNMVIVLVTVAVVSGGLLAWVNQVTAGPISQQDKMALANGIKRVMGTSEMTVVSSDSVTQPFDGKSQTFIVHKANDARGHFLGAAVESSTMGFGGELKVLVGFDAEGKVLGYTILQHSETPGLGAKVDTWFQQDGKGCIVGRSMKDHPTLVVSKDGGDIDAITASTITSRAFLKAVSQAYSVYAGQYAKDSADSVTVDGHSGASQLHK